MNNQELHERVAKALGWTVEETKSFSMTSLRELVRPVDTSLAATITEFVQSGRVIYQ